MKSLSEWNETCSPASSETKIKIYFAFIKKINSLQISQPEWHK